MPLVGEAEKEVINSVWNPVLTLGPKGKAKKMGHAIRKTSETQIRSVIYFIVLYLYCLGSNNHESI